MTAPPAFPRSALVVMTETAASSEIAHLNAVELVGRVSAAPEERDLPSGDPLVTLRVVVDRPPRSGETRRHVDVIDVACWGSRVRRSASALQTGDLVRVEGALRRRFYLAGGARSSRYEVEAARLVRQGRRAT